MKRGRPKAQDKEKKPNLSGKYAGEVNEDWKLQKRFGVVFSDDSKGYVHTNKTKKELLASGKYKHVKEVRRLKFQVFASLLIILTCLISCKDPVIIDAPKYKIFGTYSRIETKTAEGKMIYKMLEFNQGIVRIAYRVDKTQLYSYIGEFEYVESWPDISIFTSTNFALKGKMIDWKMHIGDEVFEKDK